MGLRFGLEHITPFCWPSVEDSFQILQWRRPHPTSPNLTARSRVPLRDPARPHPSDGELVRQMVEAFRPSTKRTGISLKYAESQRSIKNPRLHMQLVKLTACSGMKGQKRTGTGRDDNTRHNWKPVGYGGCAHFVGSIIQILRIL